MASDSSTSGIEGIVSGYKTSDLIAVTLKNQKNLITGLENNSLKLDVELQSYLAVNTYLQTFTDAIEALSDTDLWNTLAAASSNSSSLTATIDDTAAEGTYVFEVLQLAQAAQSTSSGVASKTSAVSPSENGAITIESSAAQLVQGTGLATLNDGHGVSHGIIKITDSSGESASIDLRGALTMEDILDAINNSGVSVTASISDDGNSLVVADTAGGTGSFKIVDSSGTTAEDLGIKGTHAAGDIVTGDEVYGLNTNTTISQLRDGQGVNDGTLGSITIEDGVGGSWEVDLSKCTTIGQIISTINNTAGITITASISDDGRSLKLAGAGGSDISVSNTGTGNTTADDLGLTVSGGGASVTGGKILADMNSVQLSSLSGASGTGLNGTAGAYKQSLGTMTMAVNGVDSVIDMDAVGGVKSDDSLSAMLEYLNQQGSALGVSFQINSTGNGIAVVNESGFAVSFSDGSGTLATDLGLTSATVADGDTLDGGDLDLKYISRATTLDSLNGGSGVASGSFTITDAEGFSAEIDIANCDTLGEVIDVINAAGLALTARINDTGDGLLLESDPAVAAGSITVEEENSGTVAADLGFRRSSSLVGGNVVLDGSFETSIAVDTDDSLTDIMNKINDQTGMTAYIMNDGSTYSPYRLVIVSDTTGAASDFLVSSSISGMSFSKTAEGQDSLLLYGSESSGSEPVLSSSSTNSNNSTVIGMTLKLSAVSNEKVSIALSRDNETIVTALQAAVDAYNELKSLVDDMTTYLEEDAVTTEDSTDYTGLLYGDSNTRMLMDSVTSLFTSSVAKNGLYTTFSDLGVSFELDESTNDLGNSSYSSQLTLDTDVFSKLLESNFSDVMSFFVNSTNAAAAANGGSVTSNCSSAVGYDLSNIIDGDTTNDKYFMAGDTIANGNDTVTISYDGPVLMDYLVVYFESAEQSLSDYKVEYLDASTNKWVTMREVSSNKSAYNVISTEDPVYASAMRLTATGTNSSDGIMRLAEIKVQSQNGVGAFMMQDLDSLTNSESGYAARESEKVDGLKEDNALEIKRLQEVYDMREASLWVKYNAMESTLALLQTKSDYFQSVMSSISGTSSSSKDK